jgi:hypothetical protein
MTRMNHRSTASSAAEQRRQIAHRAKSASMLRRSPSTAAFSTFRSARAFDRELVGKVVALRLPSSAALRDRMTRTERRWGRREKVHEPHAPTLRVDHNVSSCRRMRPIYAQ